MLLARVLCAAAMAIPLVLVGVSPSEANHKNTLLRFEFGEYLPSEPAWAAGGISCRSGQKIVSNRGFYGVRIAECSGRTFRYVGWYHGDSFTVFVNSHSGHITGVGPA